MDSFEDWYRGQRPRVLAACYALGGDLDAAGEATDEAFARAFERWSSVSAMSSPGGWVQTVALNCLRRVRRRRRLLRLLPSQRPGSVSEALPDPELWAAVRALPTRQQMAVVLRYMQDLPEAEIASVMGVARGTVASTLASARASLAAALADHTADKEANE